MIKFPLKEGIFKWRDIATSINLILDTLYWISPLLNKNCGTIEPPAQYQRYGLIAYADGSNWDPGDGEGYYYFSSGDSWVQIG